MRLHPMPSCEAARRRSYLVDDLIVRDLRFELLSFQLSDRLTNCREFDLVVDQTLGRLTLIRTDLSWRSA